MKGEVSEFVPCLDLCRLFHGEVIQPLLESAFPGLPYAAALIGGGSEVLGFDDEISSDHDWGPHVTLFLNEEEYARSGGAVREALENVLPRTFRGYSAGMRGEGPVSHDCRYSEVLTPRGFLLAYLNFDINAEIEPADWVTFPEQKLRSITAGAVYHDEIGLQAVRDRFAYYPRDVWLYLLIAGWGRIGQEEHLMGRAGSIGDELGSAVIASRLVRDIMRLCFLMEKHYAPYPKWFGTAFARLECAKALGPILRDILLAKTWREREKCFAKAWELVGAIHNARGITRPVEMKTSAFNGRPYTVCHGGELDEAMREQIEDPDVKRLASERVFGGIDQMSDSTNIVDCQSLRPALRKLYEFEAVASDRVFADLPA